nr:hypothetical protein Iba_chr06aCG14220 [Ipomoea batatas]
MERTTSLVCYWGAAMTLPPENKDTEDALKPQLACHRKIGDEGRRYCCWPNGEEGAATSTAARRQKQSLLLTPPTLHCRSMSPSKQQQRRLRLVRMVDVRQSKVSSGDGSTTSGSSFFRRILLSLPLEQTASDFEPLTMATPAVTGFSYYSGDEQQSSAVATAAGSAMAVASSDLQQRHCGRTPAVELCGAAALEQLIDG